MPTSASIKAALNVLRSALETELERTLVSDPELVTGLSWGTPRSGHPEGTVAIHVAEVLAAIDTLSLDAEQRRRLRIAAIVHDSLKHRVDRHQPRRPPNEHGYLAARHAARWLTADRKLLALIELHDEGYRAWRAASKGDAAQAVGRLSQILGRLGEEIELFVAFYFADNSSGDKEGDQIEWFIEECRRLGADVEGRLLPVA